MQIRFDQQDVVDAACVQVAIDHNRGYFEGSRPQHVEAELHFSPSFGIAATGRIDGSEYRLDEQGVRDAIAVYLTEYYSFAPERLLINLSYDEGMHEFGADIIVER
jgi:hypothetical protein